MDWIQILILAPELALLGVMLVGGVYGACAPVIERMLRRRMARRAWPQRLS